MSARSSSSAMRRAGRQSQSRIAGDNTQRTRKTEVGAKAALRSEHDHQEHAKAR